MFAYRYHFSDGETVSIEIPDDWGEILIDLDRQEYNNDHKETRRHYSLEGKVYEGMDYAVEDSGLEALFAGPTDEERLHAAIRQLSPDQQEMVRAIYFENVSVNDYAARTGVTQSAISHQLRALKSARLVKSRREGKTVFYSLADDHVKTIIDQGLEHVLE